jgi:hypothetical protein
MAELLIDRILLLTNGAKTVGRIVESTGLSVLATYMLRDPSK